MPRPVEALPCGSRSTISTCSPMAASAVPKLIAVVVLPTPPFWLAMARTRGPGPALPAATGGFSNGTTCGALGSVIGKIPILHSSGAPRRRRPAFGSCPRKTLETLDHYNAALRAGLAGHGRGLNIPIFSGLGQFNRYILTLRE